MLFVFAPVIRLDVRKQFAYAVKNKNLTQRLAKWKAKMRDWTILNPLSCNNLLNNFLIFHILFSSHGSIQLASAWKMNLNILFMQQKWKSETNEIEWSIHKIPQQQLSSLDIYHTLCLSAIAKKIHVSLPSDIHSLYFFFCTELTQQFLSSRPFFICPSLVHSSNLIDLIEINLCTLVLWEIIAE